MKLSTFIFLICIIISTLASESRAANPNDSVGVSSAAPSDTSKLMATLYGANDFMEWYMKYFPVPYGSYSKETNLLFGLSKYNAFRIRKGDKTDTITQNSSLSFFGYFTLNNQYKTVLQSNLMLNKNKALWNTTLVYSHYPLEFFGVGNDTELENQRTLNTTDFQFNMYFLWRFFKKYYLGPNYTFINYYEVQLADGTEPLPSDSINLVHNLGRQSGLGLKLIIEERDNRLNAKSGYYVGLSYQVYDKALGGEYNYQHFFGDFRYYITPFKKLTIASRFRTEAKRGDVPVQSLALIGGDYNMRGTYLGRYRDNVSMVTQLELRFPIFWILGGTVFGSMGQVATAYNKIGIDDFHYNYGLGLRLKVDSQHDVNLRFDLGFSSDQVSFIMNFSEAF